MEAELQGATGKLPLPESDPEGRTGVDRRLLYLQAIYQAQVQWEKANVAQALLKAGRKVDASAVRGTVAEKLRKALDKEVTVNFENSPLKEVFENFEDRVPGTSFRIVEGGDQFIGDNSISLRLKQPVPLGAALQAIQDTVPGLAFAVREYGVLVTWEKQLPNGAVLVH